MKRTNLFSVLFIALLLTLGLFAVMPDSAQQTPSNSCPSSAYNWIDSTDSSKITLILGNNNSFPDDDILLQEMANAISENIPAVTEVWFPNENNNHGMTFNISAKSCRDEVIHGIEVFMDYYFDRVSLAKTESERMKRLRNQSS
ncbi:MAG: hypothetical protein HGB08_02730 [Candidatus Moranbacteria bacterium]|nr:hypothetical protein [Candidatus Moranbacteria bacterium]